MTTRFRAHVSLISMAALVALCLASCKSDPPPAPAQPPTPVKPTPPEPPPPEPEPAPLVDADAARALIDRWLMLQNAGDFQAYSALYAERFHGIKRAGERTTTYDRRGWLADRERMFRRPMTVGVDDVDIIPAAGAARVRFNQSWASGEFRDIGPKQMVLVRTKDGLRIAREEMIASKVLGDAPEARALSDVYFALVLDAPYVVIGPAVETDAEPVGVGTRRPRAARAAAPAEVAQPFIGQSVALYGADGRLCTGRLVDAHVVARVVPHFSVEQEWKGELLGGDAGKPTSDDEITRQVWAMSQDGGRVLAARVDAPVGECGGALFARFEGPGTAPLPMWRERPLEGDDEARALALTRGTDAFRDMQTRYHDAIEGARGTWDAYEDTRTAVRRFQREGQPDVIVVSADAGPGCGGFGGGVWQVHRDVRATLQPMGRPELDAPMFAPQAVTDLDGDGLPELIGLEGYINELAIHGMREGKLVRIKHLPVLDLDTPC